MAEPSDADRKSAEEVVAQKLKGFVFNCGHDATPFIASVCPQCWQEAIAQKLAEAREAGARDMRERAAVVCDKVGVVTGNGYEIRRLRLTPPTLGTRSPEDLFIEHAHDGDTPEEREE